MPEYVASIDCGTTSSRFFIFDPQGLVIASHQDEFESQYPHPGWMEQDPLAYVRSIDLCIENALRKFEEKGGKVEEIKAVGITNQRETTLVWSRKTGIPYHPSIVWPDTRTTSTVRTLSHHSTAAFPNPNGSVDVLKERTGLPISTYFSGVKFRWLLDNVEEVREAHDALDSESGEGEGGLAFGTVDSWLLWYYTGGQDGGVHLTDVTNASRTMFMNVKTLEWDGELLEFFGVKRSCLPKIVSNSEVYGKFALGPLKGIPIAGMAGDQQAAVVGNKCFNKGEAKNTYGTGCFMLYNTGTDLIASTHGLLTTVAYQLGPKEKPIYALEGSVAVAGSSIKWVRDSLEMIEKTEEINELAERVEDTGGVYFVTGFSGLFAPYWDDSATGCLIGITGYTTKCHIARATLEATCFQTKAILDAMKKDSGTDLQILKVDGGMTNSDICMQIQADILGIDVERPEMRESTALGSALLAGSAIKFAGWDIHDPSSLEHVNIAGRKIFKPRTDKKDRDERYRGWNRAVERSRGWLENADDERRDVGDEKVPVVSEDRSEVATKDTGARRSRAKPKTCDVV